jgi:Protein of unknown function (DUF3421)
MINNRIASTASPHAKSAALAPWFCGGALAVIMVCGGCGGAPAEALEGEENVGQTEQAVLGSVLDYVNTCDRGFELGLSNVYSYKRPYYDIRYGILGSPLSAATSYGAQFYVDSPALGAPYTFSARACDGYAWGGGYGNPCSDWSAPSIALKAYPGSSWQYSGAVDADVLAGAWGAGYYPVDGANVPLPICSAYADGGQYLGYWYNGACGLGYGGAVYTLPSAQVLLSVPSNAYWSPYSYGFIPHNAMRGGYLGGSSLYSCRTLYQGAYVPGWTSGYGCNIAWEGGYYTAPASASEILCF